MKTFVSKIFVVVGLIATVATWNTATGQDGRKRKADPTARVKKQLQEAELPADALEKANKVVSEHAAKLKEAQGKVDAVLTSEQKAAQRQAAKDAKAAGKKGKERQAAIDAALKLSDEQKTKLAAARKELAAAQQELNTALRGALTSEQLAKAGIKTKRKKGG
jgi:hypothetical protein